jgi:hypothetical protein
MYIEEVVLSSGEAEAGVVSEPAGQVCDIYLSQKARIGRREYRYGLYNRCLLCISESKPGRGTREYGMPLRILDPSPKCRLSVNYRYLVLCLVFALLTAWSGMGRIDTEFGGMTIIAALCLMFTLQLTICDAHRKIVFFSRNGQIPLVSLLCKQPDKRTVNRFVCALSQYIDEAGKHLGQEDQDAVLNDELREHRRLKESGGITASIYAEARSRILGKHG